LQADFVHAVKKAAARDLEAQEDIARRIAGEASRWGGVLGGVDARLAFLAGLSFGGSGLGGSSSTPEGPPEEDLPGNSDNAAAWEEQFGSYAQAQLDKVEKERRARRNYRDFSSAGVPIYKAFKIGGNTVWHKGTVSFKDTEGLYMVVYADGDFEQFDENDLKEWRTDDE